MNRNSAFGNLENSGQKRIDKLQDKKLAKATEKKISMVKYNW